MSGGKVNFNYTGLAKTSMAGGELRVARLIFSYTGLAKNENGWFYLHGGKVDFFIYRTGKQ